MTPKVLAEGQTSGSGGWVKKISLDNNEGQWIVDGLQQSKKQWQIAMPPRWEANWNLILGHGVPTIKKNSAIKENVRLT